MTTVVSPASLRRAPASAAPYVALAATVLAIVLVWVLPPVGLLAAAAVMLAFAPWGRRLAERALITVVTASGFVAVVLATAWVLKVPVPVVVWPLALSAALGLLGLSVWGRKRGRRWGGSAPFMPRVGWDDVVVGVVFLGVAAAGLVPFAGASVPATLSALMSGWDHSSHLPMFVQTVHAQGWNVGSLGSDVMFAVYPMLHVGLWAAGEAVLGHGPETVGVDLVRPYIVWASLTTAVTAALLVWSAALVARTLARSPRVALTAAAITAGWCLLGTLTLMADFAFVNFLLAGGVAISTVVVGARSRAAVGAFGWFVLPAGAIAVAYLYPPMVGGIACATLVWVVVLLRRRSPLGLVLLTTFALSGLLSVPAIRFVTEPFQGRSVGDIKGGIPNVEIMLALAVAVVSGAVLLFGVRRVPRPARLALASPIVATFVVALAFAAQALVAGMPLSDSYYTKKVMYGLLLVSLPIGVALLSAGAEWIMRGVYQRSRWPMLATIGVAVAVLSLASTMTTGSSASGPRENLTSVPLPPGAWSLVVRSAALHEGSSVGLAQIIASRSEPGWVGLVADRSISDVQSGRTAAGLGSVLTLQVNDVVQAAHDDLGELRALMRSEPGLRVQWVLLDSRDAPAIRGLIEEFGPDRVRMYILG